MALKTARLCFAALSLLATPAAWSAETGAAALAKHVRVVHTPSSIAVGLTDFDLLIRRYPDLKGKLTFTAADGAKVAQFDVDYAADTARAYVLVRKRAGADYHSLTLSLSAAGAPLAETTVPVPPVAQPNADAVPLGEKVAALPGASGMTIDPALREVRIPDYAKARVVEPAPADRRVDAGTIYHRVRCDSNFPIAGARNNSFIGRQTAHPDDPSRYSMYISLRSQLFNQQTGEYEMDVKYLAELPFEPSWLASALTADGDTSVSVPQDLLRVDASDKKVKSRALGETYITGERPDGLMQIVQSVCQDDEGNIYFAADYRGCIRYNVHTGDYKAMPADVYEFIEPFLPAVNELPYPAGQVTNRRVDFGAHVYYHQGRIYISFPRDAVFGKELMLACVVSAPTKDWDNPEKFRSEMQLNAGSWPTAPHPLFDTWVQPNVLNRKLLYAVGDANRLYLISYHYNYAWAMDLGGDGSTLRLERLGTLDGRKIARFTSPWDLLRDGQGRSLGFEAHAIVEGETQAAAAFVAAGAHSFTGKAPEGAVRYASTYFTPGPIRGESEYGITSFSKTWLAQRLGWNDVKAGAGNVSIYYDVLARMRREPERYGFILDRISSYSLAPIYHAAAIPGQGGRFIGVGEYGYYQAFFNVGGVKAGGDVSKVFLRLDTGDAPWDLGVAIGLGPYCHLWRREGEGLYLYYAGYTGISRMLYAWDGAPLERYRMEDLSGRLKMISVDAVGKGGSFKWYRCIEPGLEGKVLLTGVAEANRGGNAYCTGLVYFDTGKLDAQYKLSEMSRCYNTAYLDWRVVLGEADGAEQEIVLGGDYNEAYAMEMPEAERSRLPGPKLFFYKDIPGAGVRDECALLIAPAGDRSIGHQDHRFAPDQAHLLVIVGDRGGDCLACMDADAGAFTDVMRLPRGIVEFLRPYRRLLPTPDGRVLIYTYDNDQRTSATFSEVQVGAQGRLSLKPCLTLTADKATALNRSVIAFLPDEAKQDGSYDLMIGADDNWARPDTRLRLIEDFIPPRPESYAAAAEVAE